MLQAMLYKLSSLVAEKSHLERKIDEEVEEYQKAKEHAQDVVEAQKILQTIAENVQNQAHQQIAYVVNKCLQVVFPDPYEFKIIFEQKRGKTEARLVFIKDGLEIDDPMDSSGGGVIDVVSFAFRLACLILSQPKRRKILVLDEPMKYLSADHIPAVREMLLYFSKEMNIQFVIVTHQKQLQVGKVIELE